MESIENTAIIGSSDKSGIFLPADVLDCMDAMFLDESVCRLWILKKLHSTDEKCPECGDVIPKRSLQRFWEGKRIKCWSCGKYFTAQTGTFLSGCHFDYREIILFAFMLALDIEDKKIAATLKISAESVRLWKHRFVALEQSKKIASGE